MVISQQFVEKIDRFVRDKSLVLGRHKAVPGLLLETPEDVVILSIELNIILVQVVEQVIRAEHFGNLDQLVGVAVTVEERFLAEDHGGEHGAQAPHV